MELDTSKSYALLWSGGLDSTLLLARLREQSQDFAILQYRQFWTKEQAQQVDKRIKDWNLKVFSWPMASSTVIGQKDELSIVFELALGNGVTPIVQDVVEGSRCIHESGVMTMTQAPFQFDVLIVGSKRVDAHWSLSNFVPGERWVQNGVEFWAPLYDTTTEGVKRELRSRRLDDSEASDTEDTGSFVACTRCIKPNKATNVFCPKTQQSIPVVRWSPENNLQAFRQIYG